MQGDGTIRSSAQGLCLESSGVDNTGNGNPVQVWVCTGALNQKWDMIGSMLRNRRAQKCIDNTAGILDNGNPLQLWDCTTGNSHQVWTKIPVQGSSPAPAPPSSDAQILRNPAGCLDLYANGGSGTKVVLWTCMGNSNQNWIRYSDGTIRSQEKGLCLESAGVDSTGNGNLVQVWECTGAPNQQWDVNGNSIKTDDRKSASTILSTYQKTEIPFKYGTAQAALTSNGLWFVHPGPQNPTRPPPETCEGSLQTLKMTEPDWSGESVTFIDPNWNVKLAELLAGERNLFRIESHDIPSDMLSLADRHYKYTIDYAGGKQLQLCTWESMLVTILMLSNLRASAKQVEVVNGPAQATCSNGFNHESLGNSTATSAFPPVVYRTLEKASTNSECSSQGISWTPCGWLNDCCECAVPAPTVPGWQVPTEGFVRVGSSFYGGTPLSHTLNIRSSKGCDNFVADALDFIFDVSEALLPVLPFKKDNQKEKIGNILSMMKTGSSYGLKFSNTKCS
ncbi:hypothetical protein HDU81_010643 [Chytriomyces hyalinus]|nr:hypothetical protein HDU81_010643 [Chytriomyces hyalinus]